jgi:hypothetical protein
MEIGHKSLALKELMFDRFGLLYAKQTQFQGRGSCSGVCKWQMANDESQMAEARWRMADGGGSMADDLCEVKSGGCDEEQSSEPMPEVSLGRVGGADAEDRPGQGDGVRQSLPRGVKTPQKAPNKANLEWTQVSQSREVESG